MKVDDIRQGLGSVWDSVAEGWQRVRNSAFGAMTRFRPGGEDKLPRKSEVDDAFYMPSFGWAMLGGDVFEDEKRVVVRIEVPGLDKQDLDVEVHDDVLTVSGEKRFENEESTGRYRMLQCAYGSFRRTVPLPAAVLGDQARAAYKNGVLRVELPKAQRSKPRRLEVTVQ